MKLLIATLLIYAHFLIAGDFAYPLIEGQRSNGIFQPKIYGMKNGLEVSTHPILFFVKPNIKVKKFIGEKHGFGIAGRVNIDYPTILLKILQRKKIGGMLADDPEVGEVPFMLFLSSEVLVTKILRKNSFTGKVGVSLCPGCKLDERHIIDLPIVYSRMAIYHSGFGSNLGVDYDFNPSEKIKIKMDLDLFFIPDDKMFTEHKMFISFRISEKYNFSTGYKLVNGVYPFTHGDSRWDIYPLIDVGWKWE